MRQGLALLLGKLLSQFTASVAKGATLAFSHLLGQAFCFIVNTKLNSGIHRLPPQLVCAQMLAQASLQGY
jgi:hypothetical protein